MSWLDELTFDDRGLVPVVAQESSTGELLMLAHANREALERTERSGEAHYWSRSRQSIWRKGESSGHVQHVVDIRVDCDADAVLYLVRQSGPACHTLARSCFHRQLVEGTLVPVAGGGHILDRVAGIVADRAQNRPPDSYVTYLFEAGIDKILKKVGEEATEVVIAAKNRNPEELRSESADLLFHLIVLMREAGLQLEGIWEELERRFGQAPRLRRESGRGEI